MERLLSALAGMSYRAAAAAMIAVLLLLAFEGWMLVLRKPVAEYRQLRDTRDALAALHGQTGNGASGSAQVAGELARLRARLNDRLQTPSAEHLMAASLMSALDLSASRHGLRLVGVKPGETSKVFGFEEVAFEVNARGGYLPACAWIQEIGSTLGGNASIAELTMLGGGTDRQINLSLNLAVYRPTRAAGVAP